MGRSRAGRFKLKTENVNEETSGEAAWILKRWFWQQLETPIAEMWRTLNAKLRGHYQYYGINDNWPLLMAYRRHTHVV